MVADAQFLLRLPRQMRDAVAAEAEKEGVTMSEWVRRAIQQKFDSLDVVAEDIVQMSELPNIPARKNNAWWL